MTMQLLLFELEEIMAHEFDGEKYAKASAHQKEWGASIIAQMGLKGSERVLDLGCGDGVLTAHFADLLPNGGLSVLMHHRA